MTCVWISVEVTDHQSEFWELVYKPETLLDLHHFFRVPPSECQSCCRIFVSQNMFLWYEYTHAHWAFEQDWQAQDIHHFTDIKVKKLATYTLHFQRFSLAALKSYNVSPYFNFIQEEAFYSEPLYYLDKSKPLLVCILSPVLLWNSNPWQYDYSLTWHLQINDLSEFIYVSKHLAKSDSCTKLIIWQCFISMK